MKSVIYLGIFVLTILSGFNAFGQNINDSIEIKKAFGTVFRQNGKNLTPRQLLVITKSNPEAYQEMKIAKTNNSVGFLFGFTGGLLIGWPLGTAIAGGEPNWALAGIGAGLIAVSIPFSIAYTKHAKNAVRIYNNGLKQTGLNNLNFNIGLSCNGVGIRVIF